MKELKAKFQQLTSFDYSTFNMNNHHHHLSPSPSSSVSGVSNSSLFNTNNNNNISNFTHLAAKPKVIYRNNCDSHQQPAMNFLDITSATNKSSPPQYDESAESDDYNRSNQNFETNLVDDINVDKIASEENRSDSDDENSNSYNRYSADDNRDNVNTSVMFQDRNLTNSSHHLFYNGYTTASSSYKVNNQTPSRLTSFHQASTSPSNKYQTSEYPTTINSNNKFSFALNAATSPAIKAGEDSLTYLNQGQNYELKFNCLMQPESNNQFHHHQIDNDIKSNIITIKSTNEKQHAELSQPLLIENNNSSLNNEFNEQQQIYLSVIKVCFWDPKLQETEQESIKEWEKEYKNQRMLEIDSNSSCGIIDICSPENFINLVEVLWNGRTGATLLFKCNCTSTAFAPHKHGGEKGIHLRLQIDTYEITSSVICNKNKIKETSNHELEDNNNSIDNNNFNNNGTHLNHYVQQSNKIQLSSSYGMISAALSAENFRHSIASYCRIQLFRLKGAQRKLKTDKSKIERLNPPDLRKRYQPSNKVTPLSNCQYDQLYSSLPLSLLLSSSTITPTTAAAKNTKLSQSISGFAAANYSNSNQVEYQLNPIDPTTTTTTTTAAVAHYIDQCISSQQQPTNLQNNFCTTLSNAYYNNTSLIYSSNGYSIQSSVVAAAANPSLHHNIQNSNELGVVGGSSSLPSLPMIAPQINNHHQQQLLSNIDTSSTTPSSTSSENETNYYLDQQQQQQNQYKYGIVGVIGGVTNVGQPLVNLTTSSINGNLTEEQQQTEYNYRLKRSSSSNSISNHYASSTLQPYDVIPASAASNTNNASYNNASSCFRNKIQKTNLSSYDQQNQQSSTTISSTINNASNNYGSVCGSSSSSSSSPVPALSPSKQLLAPTATYTHHHHSQTATTTATSNLAYVNNMNCNELTSAITTVAAAAAAAASNSSSHYSSPPLSNSSSSLSSNYYDHQHHHLSNNNTNNNLSNSTPLVSPPLSSSAFTMHSHSVPNFAPYHHQYDQIINNNLISSSLFQSSSSVKTLPILTTELSCNCSSDYVQKWLLTNKFNHLLNLFTGYASNDVLRLSKDDIIKLCGASDGIRLFNMAHNIQIKSSKLTTIFIKFDNQNHKCCFLPLFLSDWTEKNLIEKILSLFMTTKIKDETTHDDDVVMSSSSSASSSSNGVGGLKDISTENEQSWSKESPKLTNSLNPEEGKLQRLLNQKIMIMKASKSDFELFLKFKDILVKTTDELLNNLTDQSKFKIEFELINQLLQKNSSECESDDKIIDNNNTNNKKEYNSDSAATKALYLGDSSSSPSSLPVPVTSESEILKSTKKLKIIMIPIE